MRKLYILMCIFLMCICCGCNNKKEGTEQISYTDFPESFHKDGEKVTLDTQIIAKNVYFQKASFSDLPINYKEIGNILIPDGIVEEYIYEYLVTSNEEDDEGIPLGKFFGTEISCNYMTPLSYKTTASLDDDVFSDMYNLDKYSEPKEFAFGTAADCINELMGLLADFNINTDDMNVYTYYLDYETLKSEEKYLDFESDNWINENRNEWTEHDNLYLFYFHKVYCDLDVQLSYNENWNLAQMKNADIIAMYGENGLASLTVYTHQIEKQNEYVDFISFDKIADTIINHYDMLIDDYQYYINNAQLVVDCDQDGNAAPVWVFDVETVSGDYKLKSQIRINAVTGEWW